MSITAKFFKNKMAICLALATIILLSGVCFEKIKAQSFFECAVETSRDMFVKDTEVKLVTSCSNETLGLRNKDLSAKNNIRFLPSRRLIRIFLCEFSLVDVLQSMSTFYFTAQVVAFEKKHPKAEVLYFIHQSDGKKRA